MTLSTTQTKVSYIPDGVQTRFAVPFPIFDERNLRCSTVDNAQKEREVTNFVVEGLGSEKGVYVRFFAPPPSSRRLVLYRKTRRVQESDYPEGGKFPAVVVELDFDRVVGIVQELDEELSRAVKVPITSPETPEELIDRLFRAAAEAEYYAKLAKEAAEQASGLASNSLVVAEGSTEMRSLAERFADVVNVKDFGAKGNGLHDDTGAIQAACNTGKSVFLPKGRYRISRMIYLTAYGQKMTGAGISQTTIFNNSNDEPLFLPGNPNADTQVAEFGAIENLTLEGNNSGKTLWGCFVPCAPYISSSAHPSAVYEGWMPDDSNNYYHGKLSFSTKPWFLPARGFCIRNVRVEKVHGGYGVHASSWGWSFDDLQIYNCQRGLRISGAANSCNTKNLYISGTQKEGILIPNVPSTIPTSLRLINSVVQFCGAYEGGNASIGILKGQTVVLDGLYTEQNDLKGASRDIYVGVNAINTRLSNFFTTVGNNGPYPSWSVVETRGEGTIIGSIFQRDVVGSFVTISGSDSRTNTVLDNSRFAWLRGAPVAYVNNTYSGTSNGSIMGSLCTDPYLGGYVSLHANKQGMFSEPGKMILRNTTSTSNSTEIHTYGNLNFCTQIQNAGSQAGRINFYTNGDSSTGKLLLMLLNDNGALLPGADNASTLGSSGKRWSQVYAGNPTINTSDAREKRDISEPDEALFRAWGKIRYRTFRFINAVEEKGDSARIHSGLIAQEIQEAFASEGLDATRYGLFCRDSWESAEAVTEKTQVLVEPDIYDADGNLVREAVYEEKDVEIAPASDGGELLGIRYSEALALEAAYQRWTLERLDARMAALSEKIRVSSANAE